MTSIIFSDDSLLSIIEKFAFEKSSIDSIIIPKSVSVIAECAFASCKNLRSVNFLGNIKNISMNKSSFQNSPFEKEFNKLDFLKKRLSHQKDIRKDIENVLSKNEQKQLNAIWSHFKGFKHMSKEHYYSLFDALIIFGSEKVNKCNLERCTQAGIIPSFQVVYFNEHEGTVLLIDTKQIEIMICKSNDTLQNSFLKYYASRIDENDVKNIFKRRKNLLKKILAYNKIVNRLGCNFDYYFLFCASFEYDSFN